MRTSGKIVRTIGSAILGSGLLLLSSTLIQAQEGHGTSMPRGSSPGWSSSEGRTTPEAASSIAKPATGPAASFVGSAACKACHANVTQAMMASAHGKALSQQGLAPEHRDCEACHGPASSHIGSAGKNKLTMPTKSDPKLTNGVCGECHFQSSTSKAPKEWQKLSSVSFARSQHSRNGLSCASCHTGHPGPNEKQLAKPMPDLCLSCHGEVLESVPGKKAAYTHMPVAEGQCLTCHDPHGSADRTMVVQNVQKACLECHDVEDADLLKAHKDYPIAGSKCADCHDPHSHNQKGKLIRARQHTPFKQGKCETCHTAPVAGKPIGLVKPAKELCTTCHNPEKLMPQGEHAHLPAKEGLCLTCHNPHASREKALMKASVSNACFSCHSDIDSGSMAAHQHPVFEGNQNCMGCHKPHSSPQPKLMAKDQQALCGQCHKHSFSHPIGKKADGTILLNPRNGDSLTCASCHDIHGSRFDMLTVADKSRDLCVLCHNSLEG